MGCVTAPARLRECGRGRGAGRTVPAWTGIITLAALTCLSAVEASPQQNASRTELTGPECEACEIVAVPVLTFGDADGPGMLEADYNVVSLDRRGRYFVTGGPSPYFWVFDSSGEATRLGRRGEGPGEFTLITGLAIDETDSVFVTDPMRVRVSVYTPDLEFARTFPLSFRPDGPQLLLGEWLLVNTPFRRGDLVGVPFHVLDRSGSMTRSFGSVGGGADLTIDRYTRDGRVLARSDTTSFWAARTNQYLIERWTVDGRLLETLHREPPWFQVWWESPADADTPPVPRIIAMEQVGDTLWVLTSVAGEEWRSGVEPDGDFYRVTDRDLYRNTVVEAIELTRGVVIACQRMPLRFSDLLEGGLAVRNDTDEVGNPVVSVYRLEIRGPSR